MTMMEALMSDKRTSDEKKDPGCGSCGDDRVVLTEERHATPRCAGCGKPVNQSEEK